MYAQQPNLQAGQAVITAVIFFLAISFVVMVGIVTPIANQIRSASDYVQSKQSYAAADTLSDEGLYRLNKGYSLPGTYVLSFNGTPSSATVTDVSGVKQIIAHGIAGGLTRSTKSLFSKGVGVALHYGLQVGNGGYEMSGSSGIYGNVYSNGDIIGTGSPFITGSAIVATRSTPAVDQSNSGSTTPPYSITFATSSATQDFAQAFKVSTTTTVSEVNFYLAKNGTVSNPTVRIVNDSSSKPGNTTLATATLDISSLASSFSWVSAAFSTPVSLTPGTTYWLVIDDSTYSSSNYFRIGATDNTYASGTAKVGSLGGTWASTTPTTLDAYFSLSVGGDEGAISGVIVGTGGSGDAHAHIISNSTVAGTAFCQVGTGNNKSCDTSQVDPSVVAMPVSDTDISTWKADATTGGTRGSWSIGGSVATSTNGPLKINGDLTLSGGGSLTLNGTLYVTGNISVGGGSSLQLGSSYGNTSGIIVTDGKVSLTGGGQVIGNGQTGNYLMILTTSVCDGTSVTCGSGNYAIDASGGTGAVILVAQDGTINFDGGTGAKSAVAKKMIMGGGTTITYDSGIQSLYFTTGPSGAWNVSSWQEVSN